ncbi:MAG: ABC transporter substrate-binding protein [Rhodopseudomonas palustris]|nr:ABC transporter substrate-binding protein [Rhodopseudomonas palustris]
MIANAFTKYAVKDEKIRKWAFIGVNTDYGRGSVDAFSKKIKELGGEIGMVEYFNQGETDYYAILTKLQATDAQGLCLLGETMDLSRVVNQFFELGLNKKMILMDPTSGTFNSKFIELTKGRAEGMIGASRFVDTIETPAAQKFVAAYKARYGRVPEKYAQAGYDAVRMVAQAISRAKSTQPAAVQDALTKTQYEGPQGKAHLRQDEPAHHRRVHHQREGREVRGGGWAGQGCGLSALSAQQVPAFTGTCWAAASQRR